MLYSLFTYLHRIFNIPGFGIFRYITFRAGAAAITALIISFWFGPKIIRKLCEYQIGESAKLEAPKTHLAKAGTPTMGGLIVLFSVIIPALLWTDLEGVVKKTFHALVNGRQHPLDHFPAQVPDQTIQRACNEGAEQLP